MAQDKIALYGMGKLGRELLFEMMYNGEHYDRFVPVAIIDTHSVYDFVSLMNFDFTYRNSPQIMPVEVGGNDHEVIVMGKKLEYCQIGSFYYPDIADLDTIFSGMSIDGVVDCSGALGDKFELPGGSTYTNTVNDFEYYCTQAGANYTVSCLSNEKRNAGVANTNPIFVADINSNAITGSMTSICVAWPDLAAATYPINVLNTNFSINTAIVDYLDGNLTSNILTNYKAVNLLEGITIASNSSGKGVGKIIPELAGKIVGGHSFSYPVSIGSYALINLTLNYSTTVADINAAMKLATDSYLSYYGEVDYTVGSYLTSGYFKGFTSVYFLADKTTAVNEYRYSVCIGYDSIMVSVKQTVDLLTRLISVR